MEARFGMKLYLTRTYLDVTTAAVDVLFMFYLKLNNKSLVLVRERFFEFSRNAVELRILAGLNTCWNNILFAKSFARWETTVSSYFHQI